MIKREDWNSGKGTEIPRGCRLLAVIKADTPSKWCITIIHTDKDEPTYSIPMGRYYNQPLSDILWWQTIELPFGMEDDTMTWEYVLQFIPELRFCKHERLPVDKTMHDTEVCGCMWRVVSDKDPDFSVDIYVRTTNNPKYKDTLFFAERYRTMEVFDGKKQRILVDTIAHTTFGGDYGPDNVRKFLCLLKGV